MAFDVTCKFSALTKSLVFGLGRSVRSVGAKKEKNLYEVFTILVFYSIIDIIG